MLTIRELEVEVQGQRILKGISLTVKPGEVHAIMGPNGSGKSTLSRVIAGDPAYVVVGGTIEYEGQDLTQLSAEERAHAGVFLSFQYPVEIPGVVNVQFLKAAVNAMRQARQQKTLDAIDFLSFIREKCAALDMDEGFLYRNLNEGFSGGEKKRNEMLQLSVLEPKLAILDETDSGLDIDALRVIAKGVNAMRSPTRALILVTHYQRLLDYVEPDRVHVLAGGRIQKSGGKELALELEKKGYGWLVESESA
ncbi:MAG: Fe-S cluster assembly ATPase SufC [Gammaproteobacteria bacterium]|nr:Fe-S cluster assembly ATPase SufC [Gammaproteobacteria bacterium]